jgi:hypothetical protein
MYSSYDSFFLFSPCPFFLSFQFHVRVPECMFVYWFVRLFESVGVCMLALSLCVLLSVFRL